MAVLIQNFYSPQDRIFKAYLENRKDNMFCPSRFFKHSHVRLQSLYFQVIMD